MMQGSIYGPTPKDAESVTEHSPVHRAGIADSTLLLPEAMDIINALEVIEGWRPRPCLGKQGVDLEWQNNHRILFYAIGV